GSVVLTRALKRFVRVLPDGTSEAFPAAVFKAADCTPIDMVGRADGTLILADDDCNRIVTVADHPTPVFDLHPLEQPYGLLARADGSIWFTAGYEIGRVGPDRKITRITTTDPAEQLADAPDGSVYATVQGTCELYQVTGGQVAAVPAPFQTYQVEFAPDGSAW